MGKCNWIVVGMVWIIANEAVASTVNGASVSTWANNPGVTGLFKDLNVLPNAIASTVQRLGVVASARTRPFGCYATGGATSPWLPIGPGTIGRIWRIETLP